MMPHQTDQVEPGRARLPWSRLLKGAPEDLRIFLVPENLPKRS